MAAPESDRAGFFKGGSQILVMAPPRSPPLPAVTCRVDPARVTGRAPKWMADVGFDEIRVMLDPLGQRVFEMVRDANATALPRAAIADLPPVADLALAPGVPPDPRARSRAPYHGFHEYPGKVFRHVRMHNMFTGPGGDRQGAKNAGLVEVRWIPAQKTPGDPAPGELAPGEAPAGELRIDFSRLDAAYDTFLASGVKPFVELGFMPPALAMAAPEAYAVPRALLRPEALALDPDEDCTTEARWICNSPPASYALWAQLVHETATHLVARYGLAEVRTWFFELWNEPDISAFWMGSLEEYCETYAHTARALKAVDPGLRVGGPAVARSTGYLRAFLEYVTTRDLPLDFVSVHCKGGRPADDPPYPSVTRMIEAIAGYVDVMGQFPAITRRAPPDRLPVLINEADAFLACVNGTRDDPVYRFRETSYYPCFVAKLYATLLAYAREDAPPWLEIQGVFSDNFHMVDEHLPFGGYRHVTTCVPVAPALAGDPEAVWPGAPPSGAFPARARAPRPRGTRYQYLSLFDRDALYATHAGHPAHLVPFVVAKKPVFHVYPLLQRLGPETLATTVTPLPAAVTAAPPAGGPGVDFRVLATRDAAHRDLVVMAYYFSENVDARLPALHVDFACPVPGFLAKGAGASATGALPTGAPALRAIQHEVSPRTCTLAARWNADWRDQADGLERPEDLALVRAQNRLPEEPLDYGVVDGELRWSWTLPQDALIVAHFRPRD